MDFLETEVGTEGEAIGFSGKLIRRVSTLCGGYSGYRTNFASRIPIGKPIYALQGVTTLLFTRGYQAPKSGYRGGGEQVAGSSGRQSRQLVRRLKKQGWRIEWGRRHYKAFPPDEGAFVVISTTTKTHGKALANIEAMLRRAERGYYGTQGIEH